VAKLTSESGNVDISLNLARVRGPSLPKISNTVKNCFLELFTHDLLSLYYKVRPAVLVVIVRGAPV
jgi:hypothetical protein